MMNMVRIGVSLVLGLSTLLVGCQDPSPDKASLEYSQQLYDGCVQCHGENGEGNQAVGAPSIAGLQRWYIKRQLRGFKAGYRGYFTTADNLCRTLVRASIEGNLASKMKTFTAPTVLVIDDVGLLPIGGTEASAVFFQVVNSRYEKGHPTIVTTNRGLPDWGTIFGDTVVAAAVLDRLMHNAIVFNIKGPSWRLREHNGLEIASTNPSDGGAN